tara:strand:- start:105146 stop:106276 length:1131 start_codon:yes stop_codon:yes gene_type:complete
LTENVLKSKDNYPKGELMSEIVVDQSVLKEIENFQLPTDLSFGKALSPFMIECDYADGKWGDLKLSPYRKLELDPTCKVLHYAQEIFEGLKAYRVKGQGPFLFRPDENAKRFNISALRMAMPELPVETFISSVKAITEYSAHFIPQRSGDSLYIRPFMIAMDNNLGIKPSETFKYMVVASPSAAYFSSGSVNVLIEKGAVRACPGGVGASKTGGNYAASLLSMIQAKKKGFDQVLWLDAVEKTYVEEMSGMNFFAVYGEKLVTPELTETILEGITRKSILSYAEFIGLKVEEVKLSYKDLIADIKSGACTEAFACGTAVIITPISSLGFSDGEKIHLSSPNGKVTQKLREGLLGIQEGRIEDPFNWRIEVNQKFKK